ALAGVSPRKPRDQRDEPHEAKIFGGKPVIFAADAEELLIAVILPDGRNQDPVRREPVDEGFRDIDRCGGDDDPIVGRLLRPTLQAVAKPADYVARGQRGEWRVG